MLTYRVSILTLAAWEHRRSRTGVLRGRGFHRAVEGLSVNDRALIAYIRVSTAQQGRSGGIEAQRQALVQFAQAEGFTVTREFVEVETGKENGGGAKSMVLGQPMLAYP
jgi:Resolvase, N terminal domain